jgi:hypothetical protein
MERSFIPRSRKRGVQTIVPLQFFVFVHGFGLAVSSTFACQYVLRWLPPLNVSLTLVLYFEPTCSTKKR